MNKRIEILKKNAKDESMNNLLVVVGFLSGTIIAKGARKLAVSHPALSNFVEYGTPVVLALTGWSITALTTEKEKVKYIGYGLVASATFETIKIIPTIADNLLSGVGDNPAIRNYFTENEEQSRAIEGTTLADIPINTASMQQADKVYANLPELDGTDDEVPVIMGLGYNSAQTQDADMRGII